MEIRVFSGRRIGNGHVFYESVASGLRFMAAWTGQRPGEVTGAAIAESRKSTTTPARSPGNSADRIRRARAGCAAGAVALQISAGAIETGHIQGQDHPSFLPFCREGPIARHSMSQGWGRIIAAFSDQRTATRKRWRLFEKQTARRRMTSGELCDRLRGAGRLARDRLAVLAHAQGDVHGLHYDKYERLKEKRAALEAWERHVSELISASAGGRNRRQDREAPMSEAALPLSGRTVARVGGNCRRAAGGMRRAKSLRPERLHFEKSVGGYKSGIARDGHSHGGGDPTQRGFRPGKTSGARIGRGAGRLWVSANFRRDDLIWKSAPSY